MQGKTLFWGFCLNVKTWPKTSSIVLLDLDDQSIFKRSKFQPAGRLRMQRIRESSGPMACYQPSVFTPFSLWNTERVPLLNLSCHPLELKIEVHKFTIFADSCISFLGDWTGVGVSGRAVTWRPCLKRPENAGNVKLSRSCSSHSSRSSCGSRSRSRRTGTL